MRTRDERGAATAELAVSIPILVSLTIGLVWLLSIGVAQVQMVDAAREAARATARGDPVAQAVAAGERVAPGSTVSVSVADGTAVATASGAVGPPGGLFGFLPEVHLRARAVNHRVAVTGRSSLARRSERGSGTVLVLTFAAVLLLVGCALGVVTAMVHAHRVAESGADLAALAGARALSLGRDPCTEAARIAAADGGRVTDCRVAGSTVMVTVVARGPHWLGQIADLSARARAGPGSASSVLGALDRPTLGIPA